MPTPANEANRPSWWSHDRYKAWLKFYRKEFENLRNFRNFAHRCLMDNNNKPHLILTNGIQIITLADRSDRLKRGRPSFQIFFLVVCAESIIRILQNRQHDRRISESSVIAFFDQYFLQEDKEMIVRSFQRSLSDDRIRELGTSLMLIDIVKYFYRIRCEVAHQGVYWNFHWADADADQLNTIEYRDGDTVINDTIQVRAGTNYQTIRPAFVRAVINAARSLLA